MISSDVAQTILSVNDISHVYGKTQALNHVSFKLPIGANVGLIGPDGVGKSTLLALIAGIKVLQAGKINLLKYDVSNPNDRKQLFNHIAFMPQGLGKNLYPSLSVYENIDFIASLFGLQPEARKAKIIQLLTATDLLAFKNRPAGQLSGGMKQKLSLCCALVHDPQLLILDEPTTGVDPLSRRQFWELIELLKQDSPDMSLLVSTAYTEEAEQFEYTIAMDAGEILIQDKTKTILEKTNSNSLDQAYNSLLPEHKKSNIKIDIPTFIPDPEQPYVIEASHLTKKFADFTAVNDVSFQIRKGEIFGFLGSNGCGKSTTMKMLTGLLSVTSGQAMLLGHKIDANDIATRMKVGYMSQSFSLYEELTVEQNLLLHAKLYHLPIKDIPQILENSLEQFNLTEVRSAKPQAIPLGIRQRLQLAAACLHKPEVLILDEPTSGVDPQARDMFWDYLGKLSREDKVTIFVSTHFMNEAMLCDRISLMHKGKVLAMDTPEQLAHKFGYASLEDVFIHYLEMADEESNQIDNKQSHIQPTPATTIKKPNLHLPRQFFTIFAFAKRESLELLRDKIRMGFAILGSIIYLITASFYVTFDIEHISFAVFDQDNSMESREIINNFSASRYFNQQIPLTSTSEIQTKLKAQQAQFILYIPANYGKELLANQQPQLIFYIDGTSNFSASNIKNYINGVLLSYAQNTMTQTNNQLATNILEPRFMYNPEFKSIYAITPGILMMALILIPAMLSTLSVVREKEIGSIINFYASPTSALEYLIGKQLPYIFLSLLNAIVLLLTAIIIFGVPITGSFLSLMLGILLYVCSTTGLGLLISSFISSQLAAMLLSAVITIIVSLNFSGLIYPTSTLEGGAYLLAMLFPASWFNMISLGTITKGLHIIDLWQIYLILIGFTLFYLGMASCLLKKQEK